MLLYPLLLGLLAISFPFLSMVGLLMFSGRAAVASLNSPLKALIPFFAAPAAILIWDQARMTIPAMDAIFGVGAVVLIFLLALRARLSLSSAFCLATLGIIAYGLFRILIWKSELSTLHVQTLEAAFVQMQQYMDSSMLKTTVDILSVMWPASWMLTQILALFVGFVLFQKSLGIGFRVTELRFPAQYNILLLAILPLYFVTGARMMFVNGLVALCAIPFIQGLGLLIDRMGRIIQNKILRAALLVFLLINIISYALITLFGFADLWWNFRNIKPGGNPA